MSEPICFSIQEVLDYVLVFISSFLASSTRKEIAGICIRHDYESLMFLSRLQRVVTSERAWRRASQWIVVVKCRWWSSKCSCPELLSILYIGAINMMEHEVWSIAMAIKGTCGLTILQTS